DLLGVHQLLVRHCQLAVADGGGRSVEIGDDTVVERQEQALLGHRGDAVGLEAVAEHCGHGIDPSRLAVRPCTEMGRFGRFIGRCDQKSEPEPSPAICPASHWLWLPRFWRAVLRFENWTM